MPTWSTAVLNKDRGTSHGVINFASVRRIRNLHLHVTGVQPSTSVEPIEKYVQSKLSSMSINNKAPSTKLVKLN